MTDYEAVATLLDSAADKLEIGWTRHASARDVHNTEVDVADKSACKWCVGGALLAAGAWNPGLSDVTAMAFDLLLEVIGAGAEAHSTVSYWNDYDCPGQATAVAMVRRAAARARTLAKEAE